MNIDNCTQQKSYAEVRLYCDGPEAAELNYETKLLQSNPISHHGNNMDGAAINPERIQTLITNYNGYSLRNFQENF